jgi:hypothetical protein
MRKRRLVAQTELLTQADRLPEVVQPAEVSEVMASHPAAPVFPPPAAG